MTNPRKCGTIQCVAALCVAVRLCGPSYFACVAQLVEQLTRNEQVAGSSPATSSKRRHLSKCRCRLFLYPFTTYAARSPGHYMGAHKTVILKITIMAFVRRDWEQNNGYLVKAGYPLFFCRHEKQWIYSQLSGIITLNQSYLIHPETFS